MARTAGLIAAVFGFGVLGLGCGAKAPPRPPTDATTTRLPEPARRARPPVLEGEAGAGGAGGEGGVGGVVEGGGAGGAGGTGAP